MYIHIIPFSMVIRKMESEKNYKKNIKKIITI